MDYKNMSTEELLTEYIRWNPNPADSVPKQNMYHERQMEMLKALTPEQAEAVIDYARQKTEQVLGEYEQELSNTKTIVYVGVGLFFLFIAWAFLAA